MNDSLYTVGRIAQLAAVAPSRVNYILHSRRIEPRLRVATVRVYGAEQVATILEELRRTSGRPAPGRSRQGAAAGGNTQ